MEVILRAVFGLDAGDAARRACATRLTAILTIGSGPIGMLPFLQRDFGGRGPVGAASCACARRPTS